MLPNGTKALPESILTNHQYGFPLKITDIRLQPHVPGANELSCDTGLLSLRYILYYRRHLIMSAKVNTDQIFYNIAHILKYGDATYVIRFGSFCGSGNGSSPVRCQAITWTIRNTLRYYLNKMQQFSCQNVVAKCSVDMVVFRHFVSVGPFSPEIHQIENSRSRSRPKSTKFNQAAAPGIS